ncbi:MAG TPA: methionine--tRNA ligase, partial [Mycobacterium sp.]
MRPYYVTTAITYPNGEPHIGHAYEYIATDAIARFKRLDGFDVRFLTGTDEHGLKMVETAASEGIPTAELARRNSDVFQRLQERLNISFDRFIRTTDPDHHEASTEIWRRMSAAGDIYLDTYSGWYSVRDERFFVESETRLLDDGTRMAIETGAPVTWTEEQTYFFRLSAFADKLLAHYDANPDFIAPEVRRNEVVSFVSGGLRDLSISRTSFDWGVKVPEHPDHVMYVWVDALTNYLTGVGYPDTESELFRRYWPADLHMIGKDIIRFHTVYWPAFLMSAGIELPRRVFAHGFLLNRGEKMSKSVGNVIDPVTLIEMFGVDQVRYFLLREVPFGQDGSYSEKALITRINTDLANELGNLAQRSLSMVAKNLGGLVPEPGEFTAADTELLKTAEGLLERVRASFDGQAMHVALEAIWLMLGDANKYFSAEQPWVLRKSESESDQVRFRTVLYVTCEIVRIAALLVQ